MNGRRVPVTLWLGVIGRSHRGRDEVERRFQNPGTDRPIWIDSEALPLLLGLWHEDEIVSVPTPVVVSVDPFRREGRRTRFSVFVGLDALLDASLGGWWEGENSDGERLL